MLAAFIYFRNYIRMAREERERQARNAASPAQSPVSLRESRPRSPSSLLHNSQNLSPLASTMKKLDPIKESSDSISSSHFKLSPSSASSNPNLSSSSSPPHGSSLPNATGAAVVSDQPIHLTQPSLPDAILDLAKEFQKRSKSTVIESLEMKRKADHSKNLSSSHSKVGSEEPKTETENAQ